MKSKTVDASHDGDKVVSIEIPFMNLFSNGGYSVTEWSVSSDKPLSSQFPSQRTSWDWRSLPFFVYPQKLAIVCRKPKIGPKRTFCLLQSEVLCHRTVSRLRQTTLRFHIDIILHNTHQRENNYTCTVSIAYSTRGMQCITGASVSELHMVHLSLLK